MADEFAKDMLHVMNLVRLDAEPRVIAIVVAAYVENHLEGLIKKKMPGLTSTLAAKLFRPGEGALGSLSRKIDMAKALQAITPHYAREAVLIARIRNRFAHHLYCDNFDHPDVASLVDSMTAAKRGLMRTMTGLVEIYPGNSRRNKFTDGAIALCASIMAGNVDTFPFAYRLNEGDWPGGEEPPHTELHALGRGEKG